MADRPVIGVGGWTEEVRFGPFEQDVAFAEASFVRKLAAVGADCVIVPPQPHVPAGLVRHLDGILLPGGHDLNPARYDGPPPSEPPSAARDERDAVDLELSRLALELDLPILAVCRGCQVLNVAAGGSLVPEVSERYTGIEHTRYHTRPPDSQEPFEFAEHEVEADPDSPIARVLGTTFEVLSSHHQSVDRLGDGFRAVAWSSDGVVEAIVAPERTFAVGVQWHPEAGEELALFAALAEAAAGRRAEPSRP